MGNGRSRAHAAVLTASLALCLSLPLWAQQAGGTAVLWQERGNAAALDLISGPGGAAHKPGHVFTFIEESKSATSPKFDVVDERGIRWTVKLGEEAKTETAATRLLWAAGYVVDEDYYRPDIRVGGLPTLARGQEFVSGDTVSGVRLERRRQGTKSGTWSWYANPFVGTREFNGLRVMMALINNWDLKEVNNITFDAEDGTSHFSISDLGATFGRTGDSLSRSKGVAHDYGESRFIEAVTGGHVDLVMHSRPFFLSAVNVPNYRTRQRMESIVKNIPLNDARWIGDRLGRLSAKQIRDCFRAGGFSAADLESNARVVETRISALMALPRARPVR